MEKDSDATAAVAAVNSTAEKHVVKESKSPAPSGVVSYAKVVKNREDSPPPPPSKPVPQEKASADKGGNGGGGEAGEMSAEGGGEGGVVREDDDPSFRFSILQFFKNQSTANSY